jgi:DNA polymerase-3 subunit delta
MAKQNSGISFNTLKKEILSQQFKPIYVLMGEEPFYPEKLCDLIIENGLQPFERDFNQTILYGNDTNVADIISICQRYPMMAERVLVIVKEAQALKNIEELDKYLQHYSETTVLVLLISGKTLTYTPSIVL